MWKFTDSKNRIVVREVDGKTESCLASALESGTQIEAADVPNWSRDPILNKVRTGRCYALNALAGILTTALATTPVDHALIDACKTARQSLLDMTKTPSSLSATNDAELIAAQVAAYAAIVAAAPIEIQNAFAEMHL